MHKLSSRIHAAVVLGASVLFFYYAITAALMPNVGFRFKWIDDPAVPLAESVSSIFRVPAGYMAVAETFQEHPVLTELRVGDVILAINGVRPNHSANWRSLFPIPSDSYTYLVQRGDEVFTLSQAAMASKNPSLLFDHLLLSLIALPTLLVGFVIATQTGKRVNSARLIGYTFLAAAVALAAFGGQRYGVALTWLGAAPILPFLALAIALTAFLPRDETGIVWKRWPLAIFLLAAAVLAVLAVADIVFFHPRGETLRLGGIRVYYICLTIIGVGLISNPLILLARTLRLRPGYQRTQVTILLAFSATAILPFVLLTYLPAILLNFSIVPREITLLLLALIPLGYGYVMYRWRYLGLDVVVSRSFPMLLLALVFVTIYSILFASLASQFLNSRVMTSLFLFAAVATVPWAAKPFGDFVQILVYGRNPPDQRTLNELTERLVVQPELSSLQRVLRTLPSLAAASRAEILVADKQRQWFRVEEHALVPTDLYSTDARLLLQREYIVRGDGTEQIDVVVKLFTDMPWLEAILPLHLGNRLLGALLLGSPLSDGHYNARQIEVLRQFANVLAVTIETILLYESTRDLAIEMLGVRDAERTNIASTIHDGPLQELTLLGAEIPPELKDVRIRLRNTTNQLREIIAGLHSPILKESLPHAIRELADNLRREHSIEVNVQTQVPDDLRLSMDVANAFYQVLSEALNNIVKHADATRVDIMLVDKADRLRLVVADNGHINHLPDATSIPDLIRHRHFGLVGMHQRCALVGGEWTLKAGEHGGTIVIMSVPLRQRSSLVDAKVMT